MENKEDIFENNNNELTNTNEEVENNSVKKRSVGSVISNIILVILVSFFVVLLIFTIIYMPATVIGVSMQPTLNSTGYYNSDIVYVNRFKDYTYGDIIALHDIKTEDLIKRVIGLPGDKIAYKLDTENSCFYVWRNNEKLDEPYAVLLQEGEWSSYNVAVGWGTALYPLYSGSTERFDDDLNYTVGEDEVFVLGDNRPQSDDSRDFGAVKSEKVIGVVDFVIPYGTSRLEYFWHKIFG